MRTGYSGKPLYQKLGIKEKDTIYLINPPGNYFDFLEMKKSELVISKKLNSSCKFVHGFYESTKEFDDSFKSVVKNMPAAAIFWVSWRKGKVTDLTEDIVRKVALKNGLVDVKVCSVSEIWSGLKLVVRKENR